MNINERRQVVITATPDELRELADRAEDFGATLKLGVSATLPTAVASAGEVDVLLSLGGDYVHDPLDAKIQLHEELRIYYVVDGYVAVYSTSDGNRDVIEARGETVWEAIRNLNRVAAKPERGGVPARLMRCPHCGRCGGTRDDSEVVPGHSPLKQHYCDACDQRFWTE